MDTGRIEPGAGIGERRRSSADVPTVLVVEDNRELADMYAEWLADDYAVSVAYGGEEALAGIDASVDVALIDRRMPDLSGDAVLEGIRDRGFDPRVAVISAVSPGSDIVGMDVDDYLVKPVTADELRDAVEDLLGRPTHRSDLRELYAVASKLATLEGTRPSARLHEGSAYRELRAAFDELHARLDVTVPGLDPTGVDAVYGDDRREDGARAERR